MMEFIRKTQEFMTLNHMVARGQAVVAGVSGGADSVALLLCLKELSEQMGFRLYAVHVEHGLRGDASLEDAEFTRQLCSKLSVPCKIFHPDVKKAAQQGGMSLEEAGRMERYRIFEQVLTENGGGRIATAHHADDQAETVLMNLVRGTGARGMGGIRAVSRDGKLIRPLLWTERENIETFLREVGTGWCVDETNKDTVYTRNKIRHMVVPALKAVNEEAVSHINEAAQRIQAADDYISRLAETLNESCCRMEKGLIRMDTYILGEQDEILQEYMIRSALSRLRDGRGLKDIGEKHVRILQDLAAGNCGRKADLPGGITAEKEERTLVIIDMEAAADVHTRGGNPSANVENSLNSLPYVDKVSTSGTYRCGDTVLEIILHEEEPSLGGDDEQAIPAGQYTKWLAYDKMKDAIVVRHRMPGDYLITGKNGEHKKVKSYLIDEKVPAGKRDELVMICQGSHVLWIVGMRISEQAKVSGDTTCWMEVSARTLQRDRK